MPAAITFKSGTKAPDAAVVNQDDKATRLADFKGDWLVLYFYPKDDTPGCTVEACEFSVGIRAFAALDAQVVGCSPDVPERHRKFIAKYKLKVDLLSDPKHVLLLKYGAWGEKKLYGRVSMGVIRSTVLIDPEGKVAFHWPTVKAAGHADAVAAKLKELRSERGA